MRQPTLDEIVDRYEAALVEKSWQSVEVAQFLPSATSPEYWSTLVEVLRIRMEHAFAGKHPIGVSECVSQFPALLKQPARLSELAYEEFRLRSQAGQSVTPEEFHERWQVDVSSWRVDSSGPASTGANQNKVCTISLNAGQAFGPFRILCLLGKGALSKVYLAQQVDLSERPVVLKVCAQATLEPQKIALLQHPHIVQIFSVHEISGYQVLCMPYAGATTLADLLTKFGQMVTDDQGTQTSSRTLQQLVTTLSNRQREVQTLVDHSQQLTNASRSVQLNHGLSWPDRWQSMRYESVFCELLLQLARGLEHAHRFGIVHSDLKPANVLIGDDGQARLVDFNVAQHNDQANHSLMGGTLPYMAPEHLQSLIADRWQAGPQSDLYSLGVIAFQLLSGRLPFATRKGSTSTMLTASLEARQAKDFAYQLTSRDASADMRSIVAKLLEPELEHRYQSAGDLAEDLERHLAHRALKFAPNNSPLQRVTKWSVRHPRLSSITSVATVATVCVVALVAGLLTYRQAYRAQQASTLVSMFQSELPSAMVIAASYSQFDGMQQATGDSVQHILGTLRRPDSDELSEVIEYLDADQRQIVVEGLDVLESTLAQAASDASNRHQVALASLKEISNRVSKQGKLSGAGKLAVDRDFAELRAATDAYLSGADRKQVIERLLPLVERSPQHHAGWLLLAATYQRSGQLDLADSAYASCLALMPKHWQAWYYRGVLMQSSAALSQRREQWRAAETYYSQALKLRPSIDEAIFNRGLCREKLGELDQALDDAQELIQRSSLLVRAHLLSSRIHKAKGEQELAAGDVQAALKSKPESASDYAYLANLRMQSDPAKAAQDLQTAYELEPSNEEVLQNLAYLTMEVRRDDAALGWLNRWVESSPDSALPVASRAVFYARQGNVEAAKADCQRALELKPSPREKVQIASTFVMASEKCTEPEEAKTLRKRAISLLADAVQLEWRLVGEIARDTDMRALHSDPNFQLIVKTASNLGQLPKLIEKSE